MGKQNRDFETFVKEALAWLIGEWLIG